MVSTEKIVVIDWIDSGGESGWRHTHELEINVCECRTSGFLVMEDEKAVMVALSRTTKEGFKPYCDTITIPKCSIKNIREIRMNESRMATKKTKDKGKKKKQGQPTVTGKKKKK
jgi:hypothetical protein